MNYVPLHVHSHYSLQLGLSKPSDISRRCMEIGAKSCAITDTGSISGAISFYKEMVSKKIKPIIGCELYISDLDASIKNKNNEKLSKLVILCKNLAAWSNLVKIVSECNGKNYFHNKPRIDLDNLKKLIVDQNFICITGFYESTLWNNITSDNELSANWEEKAENHIQRLYEIFGKDNVYISIDLMDRHFSASILELREYCKQHDHNRLAGINSYYSFQEDHSDQRILLCSNLKLTLPEISKQILSGNQTGYNHFFNCDQYYILDNEQVNSLYDDSEITNTIKVDEYCESYSPLSKPVLPSFPVPQPYKSEPEYLRQLCREGWKQKIDGIVPKDKQQEYIDRIKYELEILEGAGLSSYFLIVRDILHFIRSNNWLPGPGRGSAAGCLVSYLIGITSIDPIKYSLLFERFYNAGRNTKDRISMPDIDVDVPITERDTIIRYIKDKYGYEKVSQMITFNTLKGRGALKEVLRVHDNISFEEMNNITKHIPDEAKIADELQELKDEEGSASIIKWALENNGDKLKEWCYFDEQGQLNGPLAKRFEQAIRIEGTKYNQSKHAAGIAIAAKSLSDICPMIYDSKTDQNIAGLEMNDLDALGVIKFDILGIALLDKMMLINDYVDNKKELVLCSSQK